MALRTRTSMRGWRMAAIAALTIIVADGIATAALALYAHAAGQDEPAASFNLVAVLHADAPPSLDRTRRALDRAAELYRAGKAGRIVCLGGSRPWLARSTEAEMCDYLIAAGVPEERVLVGRPSHDTRSNIRALRVFVAGSGETRVLFVVYPAHAPRVGYHARKIMDGVEAHYVFPHPEERLTRALGEAWLALHHELAAWVFTLALSDEELNRLIAFLRER